LEFSVELYSSIHLFITSADPRIVKTIEETPEMEGLMGAWTFLVLGWLATTIFACGGSQTLLGAPRVPISSLEQIAGKWEGLSKRMPDMRDHAWVILIISEKGHFNFVSNRGTDLLLGTGPLRISDGRVFGESSAGSGTFTLHEKDGHLVLVVEAALKDGYHYYLETTAVK